MKKNKIRITAPVFVNPNACDGCGLCARTCPEEVFEMKELTDEAFKELSFFGRLKVRIKGRIKSNVVHPDACSACGKCAGNCHEHAITVIDLKKRA